MHGFNNCFYGGSFGFEHFQYGGYIMMGIGLLLVLGFAYLIFKKGPHLPSSVGGETPMEILQKRYINGEISKEEFIEKTEILNKK
ncbi:hypothetical protein [Oceanispirochaeta sp.]|jgi:uncharacterized membrane protein|uniref:SHOCT domain-containing protein n=1 Tax=Oceanispirochaeta sp. TaxID=2035350 RepID=UPI0026368212|nr:hypothetical protein [Oceanispirochaeta sp.]MDA3956923.1 hypothetical protein [Oceanispirochaeta sp.]